MIVRMKKVAVVVLDRFRTDSLKALRRLGVLHVEQKSGSSEQLARLQELRAQIERSFFVLPLQGKRRGESDREGESLSGEQAARRREEVRLAGLELARRAGELSEETRTTRENIERLRREADRYSGWGDFNPSDLEELGARGVRVRLYELSPEELKRIPPEAGAFVIESGKTVARVALVSTGAAAEVPFEEIRLPDRSLSEVRAAIDQEEGRLGRLQEELQAISNQRHRLEAAARDLEQEIEFERVSTGMSTDEELSYLTGFVPEQKVDALRLAAAQNGWALLIDEPDEEDPVPTLVENPRWIQIIQPMFRLLGTVPGYREQDISFWFLLFFSLFFAMLIGDAGYGSLFLGMTLVLRLRMRKAPSGPFLLMIVLSVSTIIWGVLSGTWFGVEALARNPVLSRFIVPGIASFGYDNAARIMLLCFVIGAIQLSIAHLVNLIRGLPRLAAFSQLGWLSVVWGMFFFIRYIVLAEPLSPVALWLVVAGLVLVVLFAEQRGGFFKGLAMGVAKLPLKLLDSISAFSDIISYVRLFAVGLATVEVARAFNTMVAKMGFALPAGLFGALILFFGHGLNIAMGAMAVIVHGVRLNMLEFSGHLGMEWTGIPYQPFREQEE